MKPAIRTLWLLRHCAISSPATKTKPRNTLLFRGWRPSENLLDQCSGRKFLYAHPFALILSDLPTLVAISEVRTAILQCLEEKESHDPSIDVIPLSTHNEVGTKVWKAVLHLQNESDFEFILKKTKRVDGIQLRCQETIPWIEEEITKKKQKLDEAIANNRVHPCVANVQVSKRG